MTNPERFNEALELLLSDRSPRPQLSHLDDEEQAMVRMAQLLHGSRLEGPSLQFVGRLHDQILQPRHRVSRRTAFLSSLGAVAAGILAGVGLDHLVNSSSTEHEPLVDPGRGRWMHVASVSEVPAGAILPFMAGSVQGFLLNRGGTYYALSRVCTHMGCTLAFHRTEQSFVCPCHGAAFALNGRQRFGPNHYRLALPPLPKIDARVQGDSIQVWAA